MKRRRGHNGERGAAAVEFALVFPLLIVLLFGILVFGLVFFQWQGVQAAAREGARMASLSQTTQAQIRDRVDNSLQGVPLPNGRTIAVDPNVARPCNFRAGQTVRVRVATTTTINIPLIPTATVSLGGQGVFRCE
jgi:Flp pilus assembly protein TadG